MSAREHVTLFTFTNTFTFGAIVKPQAISLSFMSERKLFLISIHSWQENNTEQNVLRDWPRYVKGIKRVEMKEIK